MATGVLNKKSYDFSGMIVVLEASEKQSSKDLKEQDSWTEGWPKSMLLSTNFRWESGGLL